MIIHLTEIVAVIARGERFVFCNFLFLLKSCPLLVCDFDSKENKIQDGRIENESNNSRLLVNLD